LGETTDFWFTANNYKGIATGVANPASCSIFQGLAASQNLSFSPLWRTRVAVKKALKYRKRFSLPEPFPAEYCRTVDNKALVRNSLLEPIMRGA